MLYYDGQDNECLNQKHTHEYLDSAMISTLGEETHNHRFAGITSEAIQTKCGNHYHTIEGRTDYYDDHYHKICKKTGFAVCVGDGRHIHFVEGRTELSAEHKHKYQFTTLINNPTGH